MSPILKHRISPGAKTFPPQKKDQTRLCPPPPREIDSTNKVKRHMPNQDKNSLGDPCLQHSIGSPSQFFEWAPTCCCSCCYADTCLKGLREFKERLWAYAVSYLWLLMQVLQDLTEVSCWRVGRQPHTHPVITYKSKITISSDKILVVHIYKKRHFHHKRFFFITCEESPTQ